MTFYLTQFCVFHYYIFFPHWTSRQLHRAGRALLITGRDYLHCSCRRQCPKTLEDKLTVGAYGKLFCPMDDSELAFQEPYTSTHTTQVLLCRWVTAPLAQTCREMQLCLGTTLSIKSRLRSMWTRPMWDREFHCRGRHHLWKQCQCASLQYKQAMVCNPQQGADGVPLTLLSFLFPFLFLNPIKDFYTNHLMMSQ